MNLKTEVYGNEFANVKLTGLAECQAALERLPIDVSKRLFKEALTFAARAWQDDMEARAPKLQKVRLSENPKSVRIPGDLSRHIMSQIEVNSDLQAVVRVFPSKRTFWGMFQELGRRASEKGAMLERVWTKGKKRRSYGASFMEARPFMRPAFESKSEDVANRLRDKLQEIISEELKKNA